MDRQKTTTIAKSMDDPHVAPISQENGWKTIQTTRKRKKNL